MFFNGLKTEPKESMLTHTYTRTHTLSPVLAVMGTLKISKMQQLLLRLPTAGKAKVHP